MTGLQNPIATSAQKLMVLLLSHFWGTDPATNTFFVGTKAVFNKVKIRIAHNHEEIDAFYQGKVARILHACFDCLPRTTSIFQGDFIGFGGSDSYRPNTVTYIFPEIIAEDIIIAPHTIYMADDDLRNAVSSPMILSPKSTDECLFVKPEVSLHPYREDLGDICKYAKQMATLCQFSWLNDKTAAKVIKNISTTASAMRTPLTRMKLQKSSILTST